jgi:hypothetical protein
MGNAASRPLTLYDADYAFHLLAILRLPVPRCKRLYGTYLQTRSDLGLLKLIICGSRIVASLLGLDTVVHQDQGQVWVMIDVWHTCRVGLV